jgi:hypothetical protein
LLPKIVKNFQLKKKLQFTYLSIKDVQVTKEAFSFQKSKSSNSKHEISKFFLLLWVFFALLHPDPDSEYGFGSTDLIESGSGSETLVSCMLDDIPPRPADHAVVGRAPHLELRLPLLDADAGVAEDDGLLAHRAARRHAHQRLTRPARQHYHARPDSGIGSRDFLILLFHPTM